MRDKNVFAHSRALPRMVSWSPHNLYNIWKRAFGPLVSESKFNRTPHTLFQQRWISKRLVRAYHGDHINERIFKKWYLPETLPDVRPRKPALGDDSAALAKWVKRQADAEKMQKQAERAAKAAIAPVGSLMFTEVERRLDVFIFRCCFAHSVYEARRLVVHGSVKLNGKKHSNANTRLAPGDMVSVDPAAIKFLRRPHMAASQVNANESIREDGEEEQKEEAEREEKREEEREEEEEGEEGEEGVKKDQKQGNTKEVKNEETPSKPKVTGFEGQPWTKNTSLTPFVLPDYAAPFIFIPAYIEPSFLTCSAVYVRHPTARPGYSEIPTPYEADGEVVRLAWEWYAKRRPRMRSRSQLESMPENRKTRK